MAVNHSVYKRMSPTQQKIPTEGGSGAHSRAADKSGSFRIYGIIGISSPEFALYERMEK
jgi:hypothetical protein